MKLVDSTYRASNVQNDSRVTESPCWINPEGVDIFKDEVAKVRCAYSIIYYCNRLFYTVKFTNVMAWP